MGCTAAGQAVVERPGPKHGEPYGWAELACGACVPATRGSALLPAPGAAQLVSTSAWSELVRSRLAGCRLLGIRACSLGTQDLRVPCHCGPEPKTFVSPVTVAEAPTLAVHTRGPMLPRLRYGSVGQWEQLEARFPMSRPPLQPSICPFQPFWKARGAAGTARNGGRPRHTPCCPRSYLFRKSGGPRGHPGNSPKQHRSMPDAWARRASGDPGT